MAIKIGFIGLGHMGKPMALQLIKAGYSLIVYDIAPELMSPLTAHGAEGADSVKAVAHAADVIFTSVQSGDQVSTICLSEDGIFPNAKRNLLYIDCSSIDIVTSLALHEEAKTLGITMLDAPVSGGVAGAEAGTLTFMVGGSAEGFERAQPILSKMGKNIIHAGEAGNGQAAKICNNLLLGISMIGVCEAFSLAEKLGLPADKFFEISSRSSGQCWSMTSYCPVPGLVPAAPSNHDYKPGFMAQMMLKDLRLGQHAAETVDASIPLGSVATELYELYVSQGNGKKDFSGILTLFSETEEKNEN